MNIRVNGSRKWHLCMVVAPMFDFSTACSAARYSRPASPRVCVCVCLAPTWLSEQGRVLAVKGFVFLKAPRQWSKKNEGRNVNKVAATVFIHCFLFLTNWRGASLMCDVISVIATRLYCMCVCVCVCVCVGPFKCSLFWPVVTIINNN